MTKRAPRAKCVRCLEREVMPRGKAASDHQYCKVCWDEVWNKMLVSESKGESIFKAGAKVAADHQSLKERMAAR